VPSFVPARVQKERQPTWWAGFSVPTGLLADTRNGHSHVRILGPIPIAPVGILRARGGLSPSTGTLEPAGCLFFVRVLRPFSIPTIGTLTGLGLYVQAVNAAHGCPAATLATSGRRGFPVPFRFLTGGTLWTCQGRCPLQIPLRGVFSLRPSSGRQRRGDRPYPVAAVFSCPESLPRPDSLNRGIPWALPGLLSPLARSLPWGAQLRSPRLLCRALRVW
jgi:hypothetical protein